MNELYDMIFKRKSFHLFKSDNKISEEELNTIKKAYSSFKPLIKNIKTDINIVPSSSTSFNRGQEYVILIYSEIKDNYLMNVGYIGEQLDLFCASLNIGTLWFGIGKTNEDKYNGLDFVIMMGISKINKEDFRKDMYKSKRKELDEILEGDYYKEIFNISKYSPSACNTQPWKVKTTKDEITINRYKKPGKRGIMPIDKVIYYNKIDIGIFLLITELVLEHNNIKYDKEILLDNKNEIVENTEVAKYKICER